MRQVHSETKYIMASRSVMQMRFANADGILREACASHSSSQCHNLSSLSIDGEISRVSSVGIQVGCREAAEARIYNFLFIV
jgi:hypothetical protein